MAHILIIDDEILFAETVADKLTALNHRVQCSPSLTDGIAKSEAGDFDIIMLDVRLPDGNGLAAIRRLKNVASEPEIIIITGAGDPDGAELAIRHGAWCYLEKTSILKEMVLHLSRALQYREALQGQRTALSVLQRDNIVGDSPELRKSLSQLAKAATSTANVLISGESGTGKELFAKAIHANSPRRQEDFVVVDCAALPEQLTESVLFGHVRGAFTGADYENPGLIKQADRGTLFLDEVGELPLSVQKNFLRVLQERTFRPVGSQKEEQSDFRLLSATNRDLNVMVKRGLFREDLLHRLQGMALTLPTLRQRKSDLPLLVEHFLRQISRRYEQRTKEYQHDFIECLQCNDWPGNVRELLQALESAFLEAFHVPCLFPQHLPLRIQAAYARSKIHVQNKGQLGIIFQEEAGVRPWRKAKADFERNYLESLLRQTGSNKTKAAEISGLSRNRLYQLLKKYALSDF